VYWDRIADVNLNRLTESLKFMEDLVRFNLEDRILLARVRKTRNAFLKIKKTIPLTDMINFRKSQKDLGRSAKFDFSAKKEKKDLVIANITRAKESARILEEILKSSNAKQSNLMKEIRFQIYDLEKSIVKSIKRDFTPTIYAIIDEKYLSTQPIENIVKIVEKYGATMIQLRIKTLPDRKFYNYARRIKNSIKKARTRFIINNRLDIALACRADGVHIGHKDIGLKLARRIMGGNYIIGTSARTIAAAKRAERAGADYIGVGSIFKTKTKTDARVCGISVLRTICKSVAIPVVGIGGITNKNYRRVFKAGARGIAVSSYLFEGNLKKNIRALTQRR
jgi:thiamine-phosphate pyrophosphorylase